MRLQPTTCDSAALQVMVQGGSQTVHQLRRLGRALEYASDKNAVIADLKHTLGKTSKRMALMDVSICLIQGLVQHMCIGCCTEQTSKRMALVDVSICFIQDLVQHMCLASCIQQASMCLLMPGNAQGAAAACHCLSGQCAAALVYIGSTAACHSPFDQCSAALMDVGSTAEVVRSVADHVCGTRGREPGQRTCLG